VERIFKALVGSSAYESVLWEASCIRELFQSVERLEGGRESEARASIRSRALGVEKRTTPAPTTRTYEGCTRGFVTIPVDEFRMSYTHHELGCTLQSVDMEKCQRSPEDIQKYAALTEEQMEREAKVRGLLALVSTATNGKKRMVFVNRNFNAVISIRRCAVMETKPPKLREFCAATSQGGTI
jgi:hypothetical protein